MPCQLPFSYNKNVSASLENLYSYLTNVRTPCNWIHTTNFHWSSHKSLSSFAQLVKCGSKAIIFWNLLYCSSHWAIVSLYTILVHVNVINWKYTLSFFFVIYRCFLLWCRVPHTLCLLPFTMSCPETTPFLSPVWLFLLI